ncbi:major facilitator superfamily MFS_1 [Methylocella silvestris BL2]|uniref:Major facilitator superfamily MFS_1 n=1 Tax=Methylocella silvestris (strain DSM 15510 / CIP 108128 / LMG 27833 / NCIMB 13906 / BL2) TaxID=395965 RepID=B8EQU8_METSB|nr:MFS transporter [Methylocella silvestris]ACK49369.1 major facilitator superfamily MFS_1 [Methylocella silvestris BL2]
MAPVETVIPARLDRLAWSWFHTLVVLALGVTWILDGLEVTLAGSVAGALKASPRLQFSDADVGLASTAYLVGAVAGALLFGWMTDRLGRRLMFFATLGLYLVGGAATALSWDLPSFCLFRLLTGAGIGGEYSAINSTIQEMIPARYRGRTDLAINGSFWIGGALGAASSLALLDPAIIDPETGWRLAFMIGSLIGLAVLVMRRFIPESPRWLVIHGRLDDADRIMDEIEASAGAGKAPETLKPLRIRPRRFTPLREVFHTLFVVYRQRSLVGLALMAAQAFFYNAIFFTYALVLTRFYGVPANHIGWFILPFALANFMGPLALGPLFDSLGRKPMISFTYAISGALLALSGVLFAFELVSAAQLTIAWMVIFFFASAAAGAAYLTVSETFPVEIRALAIAVFYAAGTAIGGAGAPYLLGVLIATGSRMSVLIGYLIGAALMLAAALAQWLYGIAAEGRPLEAVAQPLSSLTE